MKDGESLEDFFLGLGAPPAQATVLAAQTRKRARQLAEARGIEEAAALATLLEMIAAGRRGETPLQPPGPEKSS